MSNQSISSNRIFDLIEGTWSGEGRGEFPGVTSFSYRETLIFTRRDQKTLAYEQRTQKLYDGQTDWLESHWENGFIRFQENGDLELTSAQIGRTEVLVGNIESTNNVFQIHFVSRTITNDPRMISSARTFELDADTLGYDMEMRTTKVDQSMPHLKITLQRSQ